MLGVRRAARWLPLGAALALCAVALALGSSPRSSLGQTDSPTAVAAGPEQPIANADAVRAVLPADIRNVGSDVDKLPVYKWARADMWGTTAGHIIFVTTIFPYTEDDGTRDDRLIANILTWDGAEWTPQLQNYLGIALSGDSVWLAENLTDISAYPTASDAPFTGFTASYTASGQFSDAVTRDETVAAVYDLTPTQVWTRVTHLQDVDSSNPGWTATHAEDADWAFQSVSGQPGIVATVTDSDTIDLTGAVSADQAPPAGTTTTTTTETYVLGASGFVSLTPGGSPPPTGTAAAGTPSATVASSGAAAPAGAGAAATPAPATPAATAPPRAATLCAAPGFLFPRSMTPIPTCAPMPASAVSAPTSAPATATRSGTPAG